MSKQMTVQEFFALFPDDDACLDHLMSERYGAALDCPRCEKHGKFHRIRSELAYGCQWCGHHIHPCVDTPFHNSHTPLQKWFYAMYLFHTTRHGVSAKELQRQLGVAYRTAWRMGHKIREHMGSRDGQGPLDGEVEADEAYVGGERPGKRGRGAGGKTIVFAMQDRVGELISKVVPDAGGKTLKREIQKHVTKGSLVMTDEWQSYKGLEKLGYVHDTVNHSAKVYARDGCHVNTVEAFFGIFKKSIRSTHVWISQKHFSKYLGEFEFRHNLRKTPHLMLQKMLAFPRVS